MENGELTLWDAAKILDAAECVSFYFLLPVCLISAMKGVGVADLTEHNPYRSHSWTRLQSHTIQSAFFRCSQWRGKLVCHRTAHCSSWFCCSTQVYIWD